MSRTESHFIFVVPLTIRFFVWDYFGLMRHQFSFLSGADAAGMEPREDAKPLTENIESYNCRKRKMARLRSRFTRILSLFQVENRKFDFVVIDRNQSGEPRLKFNNT
jgi:hypothetical protein